MMCDTVCLCKVVCAGDWKLILLRVVICLILLFRLVFFFFQVSLSQVSPSDFHVRMNRPHAESIEVCLPLRALAVLPWISGRVPAEVNRVPPEGRGEGGSCCIWCCTGSKEQSLSAPFHCSELLSSGPPLSVEARWNVSVVLVWVCGVSSSLLGVRVIPLLESHLLG